MKNKNFKNIIVRKDLCRILLIDSRRLGFSSIGAYLAALVAIQKKNAFTKLDIEILGMQGLDVYNKISKSIISGTAKSYEEIQEKLNAKPKVHESDDPAEILLKDPHAFDKKKPRKPKKTMPNIEKMPTSKEVFKEK
jgi:hypothetical protein